MVSEMLTDFLLRVWWVRHNRNASPPWQQHIGGPHDRVYIERCNNIDRRPQWLTTVRAFSVINAILAALTYFIACSTMAVTHVSDIAPY